MLYGRSEDCAVIDDMLDRARHARSTVLVVRGDAGAGKSTLLDFAARSAGDLRVLRVVGLESEVELPFAALHQLLRPVLHHVSALPAAQAEPLAAATGLGADASGDPESKPFAVAVAVLTLLGEVAGDTGLLCLLDDSQWFDEASAQALVFAARRLEAEGVMMLFAARDDDVRRFAARGLPERRLAGLDRSAAGALLQDRVAALAVDVRERLVTETAGNPLGLVELAQLLTEPQLTGQEPLPDPLPVGRRIETIYVERVDRLPPPAQRLILVAAAEDGGDLHTILRAGEAVSAGPTDLDPAERAGLVRVDDGRLSFRHPLVRSAVYQHAPSSSRRAAHQALADVLTGEADADRRAWHLASAALGIDDEIAAALERSATRVRARGGVSAAADALERAAQLTADHGHRCRRLTLAAQDAWLAGQSDRATRLLSRAEQEAVDAGQRSRILYLRGAMELRDGAPEEAYRLLLASTAVGPDDPHGGLDTLVLAGEAAALIGEPRLALEVGRLALSLGAPPGTDDELKISLLGGLARLFEGDSVTGTRMLGDVVAGHTDMRSPDHLLWAGRAAMYLGDLDTAGHMYRTAVDVVRASGAGAMLPPMLDRLSYIAVLAGHLATAEVNASEGLRLATHLGVDAGIALATLALVGAHRGDDAGCHDAAARAHALAARRQVRMIGAAADWALGLLELGRGRPDHALSRLTAVAADGTGHPGILRWATADLVEAAVRAGDPDACSGAMIRLQGWATASMLPAPAAALSRCRGLLAAPDDAEAHYLKALDHDARASRPLERARIELLLGENLRRRRQRSRSREHLRRAMATFERYAATAWAERARTELRASGETAGRRDPTAMESLTPQELQVAQFAAAGASNGEIAAKLFLSRRTVEYHLAKVFTKLGINSRHQLTGLPAGAR